MAAAMSEAIALGSSRWRDRAIVMLGLAGVAALSWICTVLLVPEMLPEHAATAVPPIRGWRGLEVAPVFLLAREAGDYPFKAAAWRIQAPNCLLRISLALATFTCRSFFPPPRRRPLGSVNPTPR